MVDNLKCFKEMEGTHEEFVHIPGLGNAFITGVKDKCDHNDELNVFILSNGDYLFERDYRCPTNEATYEYVDKVAKERNSTITGGTSACSKCGKVLSLKDIMGDAYWI